MLGKARPLFALFTCLASFVCSAHACSCARMTPEESFRRADSVMQVTALWGSDFSASGRYNEYGQECRGSSKHEFSLTLARVDRVWKGHVPAYIILTTDYSNCALVLNPGESRIIYGWPSLGRTEISYCHRIEAPTSQRIDQLGPSIPTGGNVTECPTGAVDVPPGWLNSPERPTSSSAQTPIGVFTGQLHRSSPFGRQVRAPYWNDGLTDISNGPYRLVVLQTWIEECNRAGALLPSSLVEEVGQLSGAYCRGERLDLKRIDTAVGHFTVSWQELFDHYIETRLAERLKSQPDRRKSKPRLKSDGTASDFSDEAFEEF